MHNKYNIPRFNNDNHKNEGYFCLNVKDFGAKGDGIHDDSKAFQACIDELNTRQIKQNIDVRGTVYAPQTSSSYFLKNPIFMDYSNIQLIGDDGRTNIFTLNGSPVIYMGIKRRTPTADMFPDGFGIYDSAYCVSTNQRYGHRLKDNHVHFQSNVFQYGTMSTYPMHDYWENCDKLTVQFFIEMFTETAIFGMGDWQKASCWNLSLNKTSDCLFCFNTAGSDPGATRMLRFTLGNLKGPIRGTIQIDLSTGTYCVLLNDKSINVTYTDWTDQPNPPMYDAPWKPGSELNLKFRPNDSNPFVINPQGLDDFTLYGLHLSNSIRYTDPGVGNTFKKAPDDSSRYFLSDKNTIAYLNFDPEFKYTQHVSFASSNIYGTTVRVHKDDLNSSLKNISIKNLNIQGCVGAAQSVSIASIFNVELFNLKVTGQTPIGSYNAVCSYPVTMKDCELAGNDCAIFPWFMILKSENIYFSTTKCRDVIRSVSCTSYWENIFVGAISTDTVFKFLTGAYGAQTIMKNVISDLEGYTVKTAFLLKENCSSNPATGLILDNIFIGSVGNCPCIILRDMADVKDGNYGKAWVEINNISTWGTYSTFLQTDGKLWDGKISAYFLPNNPTDAPLHTHITKWGPESNVEFTNTTPYTVVKKTP
jgi:hypothetical protein